VRHQHQDNGNANVSQTLHLLNITPCLNKKRATFVFFE